jgi:hypothetical protein
MKIKINKLNEAPTSSQWAKAPGDVDPWVAKKGPFATADKNMRYFHFKIDGVLQKAHSNTEKSSAQEIASRIIQDEAKGELVQYRMSSDKEKYRWRKPTAFPIIRELMVEIEKSTAGMAWPEPKDEAKLFFLKVKGEVIKKAPGGMSGSKKFSIDQIVDTMITNGYNPQELEVFKSGGGGWKAVPNIPEIMQHFESGQHNEKKWWFRINGKAKYHYVSGKQMQVMEKFSAMELAKFLNESEEMADYEVRDSTLGLQGEWQHVVDTPEIEKAIVIDYGKEKVDKPEDGKFSSDEIKTVKGIKVRIGDTENPCMSYSPENSESPFGNKHFDPFTQAAIQKGEWECNTETEDIALQAISSFVQTNKKIEQDVVDAIIKVAKEGESDEPLHPEKEIDKLYRGSSRKTVDQAKLILKDIDWSTVTNKMRIEEKWWFQFNYNGSFLMLNPVSSFTDDISTSTQFARGGATLSYSRARDFQFVYETEPAAAAVVGNVFLNFDKLYRLIPNSDQPLGPTFYHGYDDFGSYEDVDQEILLMGQKGSKVPIGKIWVNWSKLTQPDVVLKIVGWKNSVAKRIHRIDQEEDPQQKDKQMQLAREEFTKWLAERREWWGWLVERHTKAVEAAGDPAQSGVVTWDYIMGEINEVNIEKQKILKLSRKAFFEKDNWYDPARDHPWFDRKTSKAIDYDSFMTSEMERLVTIRYDKIRSLIRRWQKMAQEFQQATPLEDTEVIEEGIITLDKNGMPNTGDPEKDLIILELLKELGINEFITF